MKDNAKALEKVNVVRDALEAEVSPLRSTSSVNSVDSKSGGSVMLTPLRSEISNLRGVLNNLTDQKQNMANEMLLLQARSADYAHALSRAQSQLVEKESHVLYLQSRETVLLLERDALLKEIAKMNDDIAHMSSCMPTMEEGMQELAVANEVGDKWRALDASEANAKAAVDKTSSEVEELKVLLEKYSKEATATAKKLDDYHKEQERVRILLLAKEEAINELSRYLVSKDQERETLMEQVLSERSKLPVLSAAIAAARAKVRQYCLCYCCDVISIILLVNTVVRRSREFDLRVSDERAGG
jgi:chromosome segregation ATPase